MRVPHFLSFTLGLSAMLAFFGCSRESSVKENVNLKNNHSRVFAFNTPIENPSAFADSMANTAVNEADSIPDTLTVTVNDTVYLIGLLPYNVDKISRFQWTVTKKRRQGHYYYWRQRQAFSLGLCQAGSLRAQVHRH